MAKRATSIYPRHFLMNRIRRQSTGFILMPFSAAYLDVTKAIRQAILDGGLTPRRADDEFLTRASLEKVLRGILEAEVVVADMTGRNANVFYEVGIAHATKENVVLLAQSIKDDVPFDLQHIDHLEYTQTKEGLLLLTSRLGAIIKRLSPEPQALVTPTAEGGLRIQGGVAEHQLYGIKISRKIYLRVHLLVTNESNRSLTLIAPTIEFDDRVVQAKFDFLTRETGSGRRFITMASDRTAVVCATFTVTAASPLRPFERVSGVLGVRVAQSGLEPYHFPFEVAYIPYS